MKVSERPSLANAAKRRLSKGASFNPSFKLDTSQVVDKRRPPNAALLELLLGPAVRPKPVPKRLPRSTPGMRDFIKYNN